MKNMAGKIIKVSGPLVVAEKMQGANMYDVVRVGHQGLVGEIVEIKADLASIQVYEETGGLGPGDPVTSTGSPLSVELGPGLIEAIFDGIQRPLDMIYGKTGNMIQRGVDLPSLDRDKVWQFQAVVKKGDRVSGGDILGTIQETVLVEHRVLVPPGLEGEILEIKSGKFKVSDIVGTLKTKSGKRADLGLIQKWPVRKPRPYREKLAPTHPLATGQRIIDMFFPVAKGGTACIPGPFGSGKTVVQHQLAKWSDADIIVYIGCGERGNEMADVLLEFPELLDPRSGEPLMKRTILIANTSNMPVAAREASIYTGITIAEYFRDMGYHVALMADSTSRWAEALREMSGRLEEMPGEEGYPAYLPTRMADFYERAGLVKVIGSSEKEGSLSAIGAVSPPGGDMSDPVVQATLKIVKAFWGLDANLAYRRHFPAINWLLSYSLYHDNLEEYLTKDKGAGDWETIRIEAMSLLHKESELEEIVRLVGTESLSPLDQLTLSMAKSIREDFLYQNAFHKQDSYTSLEKQYSMLKLIIQTYHQFQKALETGCCSLAQLTGLPIMEKLARMKFLEEKDLSVFDSYREDLKNQIASFMNT
ncbi:MAG: V-type ATP synthase subunit A [bacterium]